MLKSLKLQKFRTFRNFSIQFQENTYLVGPNSAGKSTILTALRLGDSLLRQAYSRRPTLQLTAVDGLYRHAYPISLSEFPTLRRTLRHEFSNDEVQLNLRWRNGHQLTAVWPETTDDDYDDVAGYFYLHRQDAPQLRTPAEVRRSYPSLGVVPILSPVDQTELQLSPDYVRRNMQGRLSSRHFRNQVAMLAAEGELEAFWNFAEPWLPELTYNEIGGRQGDDAKTQTMFLYVNEENSRVPKEVNWTGDGMQVWL